MRLFLDTRNGLNLKLLEQALEQLLASTGTDADRVRAACGQLREDDPLSPGKARCLDLWGQDIFARFVAACEQIAAQGPEAAALLHAKVCARGEPARIVRILAMLEALGAEELFCPALPLPAASAEDDAAAAFRQQLLQGLVVEINTRGAGVSPGAALFVRAINVRQVPSLAGTLVARARVQGSEGTPFEAWLLEGSKADEPGSFGPAGSWEQIVQLETNVDHLTGEELGLALTALVGVDGVVDVLCLTGLGKKNRPMHLVRVLCRTQAQERAAAALLRHTHTLGFRKQVLDRFALPREKGEAALSDGTRVQSKDYLLDNIWYQRPECDEVARLAGERGMGAPALRITRRADRE